MQNRDLKPEEQMISALPDIKRITLSPDDEFMVIACDGIWNFMTSEEVVEFVKKRISDGRDKISTICEEVGSLNLSASSFFFFTKSITFVQLFTNCLASNTMGDGTGCDNMTAVIVQFKKLPPNVEVVGEAACDAAAIVAATKKRTASSVNDENEVAESKRIKTDDAAEVTTAAEAAT